MNTVLTRLSLKKSNQYKKKLITSVLGGELYHPEKIRNMTKREEEAIYPNLFEKNLNLGCELVGHVTFYKGKKIFWRCFLKVHSLFFKMFSEQFVNNDDIKSYTEPLKADRFFPAIISNDNYLVWDIYNSEH